MFIKVCGMREADNIRAVESLGVDFMGFIFYDKSSRVVAKVPGYMPLCCKRVGVFVNADTYYIIARAKEYGLHYVQLHGDETPADVLRLRRQLTSAGLNHVRIIRMAAVRCETEACEASRWDGLADLLLFDTPTASYGGSGESFPWHLLASYRGTTPFLLSGGIGPDSLSILRTFHHPRWAGIDLNSRFEVRPALKDIMQLKPFVEAAKKLHTHTSIQL